MPRPCNHFLVIAARLFCLINMKNNKQKIKRIAEVILEKAPKDGVFPLAYYTTTNLETSVRVKNNWLEVKNIEMDKGIRISRNFYSAQCVIGNSIKKGDLIVVGEKGIKIKSNQKQINSSSFGFMMNETSTERSKSLTIEKIAQEMKRIKQKNGRIILVGGPAIVHTGAANYVAKIIAGKFIDVLFGGNALATHDLEQSYLGTSLGIDSKTGQGVSGGHHHHLRTINMIRYFGSIKKAVAAGTITSGIMYEATKQKLPFVLAGSIRDDGPIPEVITDAQKAQEAMRKEIQKGADLVIMVATTLHSVAVGNLLSAKVKKVFVDVNPSAVIKLSDRGTLDSISLVTDCEFFFSQLEYFLNRV